MSLASRVASLETKQKRVLRCPWCRFALRDTPPQVVKRYNAEPESVLPTSCWHCGTNYLVPLRGLNAHQREVTALIYNSHPTKQFTDERVHAALIWSSLYRSEVKEYERKMQNQTAPVNRSYDRGNAPGSLRDKKARSEREDLEQRAWDFTQGQLERFKRLAGVPEAFPLDQTIEQIERVYPASGYDEAIDDLLQSLGFEKYSQAASSLRSALATCNLHLQNLKKREALEIVLWNEPLPETLAEVSFFEKERERMIEINPANLAD